MSKSAKTKFLITVDVETYFADGKLLPFDANIYGTVKGKEYGVPKIMQICDNFQIKGTFFVDVYEHYQFGSRVLKALCQLISNTGHSVQLHAHPNFIPDYTDKLMNNYDYQTQERIIVEGKQLLESWTGKSPIAFRAGAYGANLETIQTLQKNNFLIDSSYFVDHNNCVLSKELNNRYQNRLFAINEILEVPVTVYNLPLFNKKSKIDLNACSLPELKDICGKFIMSSMDKESLIVVLFLHSFSFIRWDSKYSRLSVDYKTLANFEKFLEFLFSRYHDKIEFVTPSDLAHQSIDKVKKEELFDFVPVGSIANLLPRYLKRHN